MCLWVWLHWQTLLYCIFTILACCKGPKGLEVHWLVGSMQLPHANLTKYHPSWHSAGRQEYLVSTFSRCCKKGERTYAIVRIPSIIEREREREVNVSWLLSLSFAEMFIERSDSLLYDTVPSIFKSVLMFWYPSINNDIFQHYVSLRLSKTDIVKAELFIFDTRW